MPMREHVRIRARGIAMSRHHVVHDEDDDGEGGNPGLDEARGAARPRPVGRVGELLGEVEV